jgi:hypothetical protein
MWRARRRPRAERTDEALSFAPSLAFEDLVQFPYVPAEYDEVGHERGGQRRHDVGDVSAIVFCCPARRSGPRLSKVDLRYGAQAQRQDDAAAASAEPSPVPGRGRASRRSVAAEPASRHRPRPVGTRTPLRSQSRPSLRRGEGTTVTRPLCTGAGTLIETRSHVQPSVSARRLRSSAPPSARAMSQCAWRRRALEGPGGHRDSRRLRLRAPLACRAILVKPARFTTTLPSINARALGAVESYLCRVQHRGNE